MKIEDQNLHKRKKLMMNYIEIRANLIYINLI